MELAACAHLYQRPIHIFERHGAHIYNRISQFGTSANGDAIYLLHAGRCHYGILTPQHLSPRDTSSHARGHRDASAEAIPRPHCTWPGEDLTVSDNDQDL